MKKNKELTKKELLEKIKLLKPKNKGQRNEIVCALVGHSLIQEHCFGYFDCGRCGQRLGDSLGSIYLTAEKTVLIGHNCKTCRSNYKKLSWRDKIYCPNPFKKSLRS